MSIRSISRKRKSMQKRRSLRKRKSLQKRRSFRKRKITRKVIRKVTRKMKGGEKGIDGFTNEERKTINKKVVDYYFKLFSSGKVGKDMSNTKKICVPYPLDDPRLCYPVKDMLKSNMNSDGSLKNTFTKLVGKCQKRELYVCKK